MSLAELGTVKNLVNLTPVRLHETDTQSSFCYLRNTCDVRQSICDSSQVMYEESCGRGTQSVQPIDLQCDSFLRPSM